jgi:hypothetical protein
MNRMGCFWMLVPCLTFVLAGCEGEQESGQAVSAPESSQQVTEAIQDLAGRLDVPTGDIKAISEETVTWRDGSLGCPQEGMMYTQAMVPGTLIVLRIDDAKYEYHSGGGRPPFYCENPVSPAAAKPSLD